jgi:hypothetical protein
MIESYAATLYASGILDSAASVLEQRLVADAANVETLNTLGAIYRKQGRLSDAARIYERVTTLAPGDAHARFLASVLNGQVPPALPDNGDALQPAPFAFVENFLPAEFHHNLLARVLAAPDEDVVPSTVGLNEYNPDRRVSFTVGGLKEIQSEFWSYVSEALPSLCPRLQVPLFPVGRTEVRVRTYRAGNFFEVHRDNSIPESADRTVSFVYFFHRVPRRYTGGELLLFDTSPSSKRYSITNFTRVVPVDNALIMFPSRFYHAVVPVECTSPDPGDTRFVINGHIRRADAAAPAA